MSATYAVQEGIGSGPTWSTITNARFRTDDTNTQDLTNSCIIDNVKRYSYWKSITLLMGGTFTQISNIRHYSDGTLNTWTLGTTGKVDRGNRDSGDIGCPDGSYNQASGTPGVTGNTISASHTYYSGQTVKVTNLNSDTSGSPAIVDSNAYTSGGRTNHIVLQVEIDTDATQGVMSAKTLTWEVDEI